MHSAISLLHWVSDLLDEVTDPVLIEENGMSPEEQLAWLGEQVSIWNKRLVEYWEHLEAMRPTPDPEKEKRWEEALLNSPEIVLLTGGTVEEKLRELGF